MPREPELRERRTDPRARAQLPRGREGWRRLAPLIALVGACTRSASQSSADAGPVVVAPSSEGAAWLLVGSDDERFTRVARHLRGFDVAMAETGYRYGELHWAAQDRNWGYAEYQLHKIETAIANGIERRPRRAASARMLGGAVAQVRDAITRRDGAALDAALVTLTATCNACHNAERVPFVRVVPPAVRTTIVSAPDASAP